MCQCDLQLEFVYIEVLSLEVYIKECCDLLSWVFAILVHKYVLSEVFWLLKLKNGSLYTI